MPRFASAVSKACVVSVSSKLVAGGLLSSTLVRLRGVEALGRDGIRVDQRATPAEAKQRVARGRAGRGRGHLVEVVELIGGLEIGKVEEVGSEGVDERVEGHAVLPRGGDGGKLVSRKLVRW